MASIKEVYKAVEDGKANQVDSKTYSMPLDEFIDEHKDLIKILREGSREELLTEAQEQEDELEECLKEHGIAEEENDD